MSTTSADLQSLALQVSTPNDEILNRAAVYLERDDLSTAHNLVCDVISNYGVNGLGAPIGVIEVERDLRAERIDRDGSIGRPVNTAAPNLRGGW